MKNRPLSPELSRATTYARALVASLENGDVGAARVLLTQIGAYLDSEDRERRKKPL